MITFTMKPPLHSRNVVEHRTGMAFETDPVTGQQVCTNEGIVTWSSNWPPEALAQIAILKSENANLRAKIERLEAER